MVRRLGEGGMGTVFLAEQINLGNRPVALKVLRRRLLEDPEFLQRFRDEASSTGRIHHQNVVTVYECAQTDDGSPYIAMEFLEGESLREVLKRRGALPLASCATILQQAARGLNAAHKLGIVHRDLKPDNIFLTHDDEGQPLVKIVDFGIAKMRESSTHTMTGMAVGTPAYMSAEQASGMRSEDLDCRSDIYSLGIVLYEMLSGSVPFEADTPLGYVRKHLVEAPLPLQTKRPDLLFPAGIEQILLKALAKERDQRYATAGDFAREFANLASPREPAVVERATVTADAISPAMDVLFAGRGNQQSNIRLFATARVGTLVTLFLAGALSILWFALKPQSERKPSSSQTSISAPPTAKPQQNDMNSNQPTRPEPKATTDSNVRASASLKPQETSVGRQMSTRVQKRGTIADGGTGPAPPASARELPKGPVPVGGRLMEANLIRKVAPIYPAVAKSARIQGMVEFHAIIGKEGDVTALELVRGHPFLVNAARDAVLQWKYKPTYLNDQPVEVVTDVVINFMLNNGDQSP
jgi:TonB family protein